MKIKRFEHQKKETCKISGKPINTEKDKYCILLECDGEEINSIGFYNHLLLNNILVGNLTSVKKELLQKHQIMARGMLNQVGSMVGLGARNKTYDIGGKF